MGLSMRGTGEACARYARSGLIAPLAHHTTWQNILVLCRGWLGRLKLAESDLTECQRLYGLLLELVTDYSLPLELKPHQVGTHPVYS